MSPLLEPAAAGGVAGGGGGRPPASAGAASFKQQQQQPQPWNVSKASRARAKAQAQQARRASQCSTAPLAASPGLGGQAGGLLPAEALGGGVGGGGAKSRASIHSVGSAGSLLDGAAPPPVDLGTLAFLPYHDSVVAHFRVVVGDHVRAALHARSE